MLIRIFHLPDLPETLSYEIPGESVHGERRVPLSRLFICPVCGIEWARAAVYSDGCLQPFEVRLNFCTTCKPPHITMSNWGLIPGSVWDQFNQNFNQTFPKELLERELEIHINHFLPQEHSND